MQTGELATSELTLQLNGSPDADKFATFVSSSRTLIKGISNIVVKGHRRKANRLHWYPSSASINGAAIISYEAPGSDPESFMEVEHAFFQVGNALRSGSDIHFTHVVEESASRLRKLVDGDIESLVFMTQQSETIVKQQVEPDNTPSAISAFDEVEGRIETISSRKGLRFILYDSYFDKAVTCYVNDSESEQELTYYFGKVVRVMGLVTRDPESDRPYKIKDIEQVTLVEPPKYSWRDAKNSLQFSGELTPERFIRNLRDV